MQNSQIRHTAPAGLPMSSPGVRCKLSALNTRSALTSQLCTPSASPHHHCQMQALSAHKCVASAISAHRCDTFVRPGHPRTPFLHQGQRAVCQPRSSLVARAGTHPAPSTSRQTTLQQRRTLPASLWGRVKAVAKDVEILRPRLPPPPPPPTPEDDEDKPTWGLLDARRWSHQWDVPWGWKTTVGGMALWFASFIVVGIVAVPGFYKLTGINPYTLSAPSRATFTLVSQAAETVVGLAIIRVLTVNAMKEAGEPESKGEKLFNYSPKEPFSAPYGWATWALAGMALAPLVVGLTASLVSMVGYDNNVGGKGTVDGVASMIEVDWPSYLSLLSVTGVLAPILEETVFRGFLLTSLTKSMPSWAAVAVSSLAFGAAHLSARDLPVLVALGGLLGFSYIRSRNLLTPIIIHGAWNSTVLTLLFGLAASGVDVETALRELR